jgi:hypothetical protein
MTKRVESLIEFQQRFYNFCWKNFGKPRWRDDDGKVFLFVGGFGSLLEVREAPKLAEKLLKSA